MTLASTKEILVKAQAGRYAVPAFNIHNMETLMGVVETAAEWDSPVILAATPGTIRAAGGDVLLALARAAAARFSVPVALHLDHFEDPLQIKALIDLGYPSVMIDASRHPIEKNIEIVREVVDYARQGDVTVEAELGCIGGQEDDLVVGEAQAFLTDPEQAEVFVRETGLDALAVAIGTSHGLYRAEPQLDFPRLKAISDRVRVPLVLHGASGLPEASIKQAISLGIAKINIATELKIAFAQGVKQYFAHNPGADDPRQYMQAGKDLLKAVVAEKIRMCGSVGRAGEARA